MCRVRSTSAVVTDSNGANDARVPSKIVLKILSCRRDFEAVIRNVDGK